MRRRAREALDGRPPERAVLLRGRDYTTLGQLAAVGLPGGGAVALTRGAKPKSYAHVDPNEDGALVLDTEVGSLIAVVDGHHGRGASELAIEAVREASIELLRDDSDAFRRMVEAVIARVVDELHGTESRTCLVLATLIGGCCRWASFGDSVLLRGAVSQPVSKPNPMVLRPELSLRQEPLASWCGSFMAESGERIATVTDGVTNFVYDLERMRAVLSAAPNDLEAARNLVGAAMLAGAGDNAAVAACSNTRS
jgi:serine/threonine protein phosphatase PrpC